MKNSLNYSYFDLDIISKFESFEEFPNTKPVVLADSNGLILYANNSARIKHKFKFKYPITIAGAKANTATSFSRTLRNAATTCIPSAITADSSNRLVSSKCRQWIRLRSLAIISNSNSQNCQTTAHCLRSENHGRRNSSATAEANRAGAGLWRDEENRK